MGCRDCLLLATGGSEKERPFYDAFGQTISQTFVACTEAGASVKVVDEKDTGKGICGWSSFGGFACVGLDVGKGKGWASMVDRDTKEVKVMWAEIDGLTEGGKATATTSSAKEKASQTEEKGVVVSAIATTGPEETESAAASSSAASPAPTGSAGPNSAAGRKGLESSLALVGIVVLLVAAY